jgi:hypothetical protein
MLVKNRVRLNRRGREQGARRLSVDRNASQAKHLSVADRTIKHDLLGQTMRSQAVLGLSYTVCRLHDLLHDAENRIYRHHSFLCPSVPSLVHPCLQRPLNHLVRRTVDNPISDHPGYKDTITHNNMENLHDNDDRIPALVRFPVNGVEQCLGNGLEEVFGRVA